MCVAALLHSPSLRGTLKRMHIHHGDLPGVALIAATQSIGGRITSHIATQSLFPTALHWLERLHFVYILNPCLWPDLGRARVDTEVSFSNEKSVPAAQSLPFWASTIPSSHPPLWLAHCPRRVHGRLSFNYPSFSPTNIPEFKFMLDTLIAHQDLHWAACRDNTRMASFAVCALQHSHHWKLAGLLSCIRLRCLALVFWYQLVAGVGVIPVVQPPRSCCHLPISKQCIPSPPASVPCLRFGSAVAHFLKRATAGLRRTTHSGS
jgi:hypothetical protein